MSGKQQHLTGRRSIGEVSAETVAVVNFLKEHGRIGRPIPYEAISAAAGRDVQSDARHILSSALYMLTRDHGMVFGNLRNYGVQLLDDQAVSDGVEAHRQRVRRMHKKELQRQLTVRTGNLSPEQRMMHGSRISWLNIQYEMARPRLVEKTTKLTPLTSSKEGLKEWMQRPRGVEAPATVKKK